MNILILQNAVQNLKTAICGSFQLYFCKNLFDPDEKSKIINHKMLNKSTLQTSINEIFSTEIEGNDYLIKKFNEEDNLQFFLGDEKKKKKKMYSVFIPSNSIGEICLDSRDLYWYMINSSYFNIDKEIPFFKLLIDMASLRMRYFQRINANRIFLSQIIMDLGHATTYFLLGFNKLKELGKDLFGTGDIETLNYCLEIYRQHLNHEKLDFFIADKWEIKEIMKNYIF